MVVFRVDRRSGVATYLQIVRQVEQALRMGVLREGDQLPTAARVAAATKVNPNTTLKAYRELERAGLAEVRQGAGTFITRSLTPPQAGADSPLRTDLETWLRRAHADGLTEQETIALFDAVRAEVYPASGAEPETEPGTAPEQ